MIEKGKYILILMLVILLIGCFSVNVFALSNDDVKNAVNSQGKEVVSGNIFIWFLCALGFLKISQKIDSFMSSLGISVGNTGGSLLGEAMIATRGLGMGKGMFGGGGFGKSKPLSGNSGESFLAGGLSGVIGRKINNSAIQSAIGQGGGLVGSKAFDSSLKNNGDFANDIIGQVAKGNMAQMGSITGESAGNALSSYMGDAESAVELSELNDTIDRSDANTGNNVNVPNYTSGHDTSGEIGEMKLSSDTNTSVPYNYSDGGDYSQSSDDTGYGDNIDTGLMGTGMESIPYSVNSSSAIQSESLGVEDAKGVIGIGNSTGSIPSSSGKNIDGGERTPYQAELTGVMGTGNAIGNMPAASIDKRDVISSSRTTFDSERSVPTQTGITGLMGNKDQAIPSANVDSTLGKSISSTNSLGANSVGGKNTSLDSTGNTTGGYNSSAGIGGSVSIGSGGVSTTITSSPISGSSSNSNNISTTNSVGVDANSNISSSGTNNVSVTSSSNSFNSSSGTDSSVNSNPQVSVPKYSNVEIGGGRMMGTETSLENAEGIKFGMYNTEQYMPPSGEYIMQKSVDGASWYKQYATDTVEKKPIGVEKGKAITEDYIVKRLPQPPKRKDKL